MAAAPPASRRVVFVTSKYWKATSKVGFHFLAQSFARDGWNVLFITTHMSWLAAALGKRRHLARRARAEANRLVEADGVASYAWYTPWQPANLRSRLLNRATMTLFRRYGELALGVEPLVATADRIIFDSGPELLLLERFTRLAPEAAFVYRVPDPIVALGSITALGWAAKTVSSAARTPALPSPCGRPPRIAPRRRPAGDSRCVGRRPGLPLRFGTTRRFAILRLP